MYQQIVVGTDGSSSAQVAVNAAIELAALTGAQLHVVYAHNTVRAAQFGAATDIGVNPGVLMEANAAAEAEGLRVCEQAVKLADGAGVRAEPHCVGGTAAETLVRIAGEVNADLIVVGNRGMTGARRFVLGSVPNKVAHHCPTSILIVDTHESRAAR